MEQLSVLQENLCRQNELPSDLATIRLLKFKACEFEPRSYCNNSTVANGHKRSHIYDTVENSTFTNTL